MEGFAVGKQNCEVICCLDDFATKVGEKDLGAEELDRCFDDVAAQKCESEQISSFVCDVPSNDTFSCNWVRFREVRDVQGAGVVCEEVCWHTVGGGYMRPVWLVISLPLISCVVM